MLKHKVTIYGGYAEEKRQSMEVYLSNLRPTIRGRLENSWNINIFRPSLAKNIFSRLIRESIRIRCSKYIIYPYTARQGQGVVNHIIDQSYGYLVNFIDPKKTIVTVHDLIPVIGWMKIVPGLTYPHYPALFKLSIASLKRCKAIIAVSENTKKDLIRYCGVEPNIIHVIYSGVNDSFHPLPNMDRSVFRVKFGLPIDAYIVLITGDQQYKNQITSFRVIRKLEGMVSKPIQLVWLACSDDHCEYLSLKIKLMRPVIKIRHLSVLELNYLYNCIDCLLFPSWYEGCGWPPLEAMASGTPVVTSNAGPLPEIVGNAALTCAPDDTEGLADSIRCVLTDKVRRMDLIRLGYNNVRRFSWADCVSKVDRLYEQVITGE